MVNKSVYCLMKATHWDAMYERWTLVDIFADEDLANGWATDMNEIEDKSDLPYNMKMKYVVEERVIL